METYRSLQELFRSQKRWTKGQWARAKDGRGVDEQSPKAVCFCLSGAVSRVYPERQPEVRRRLFRAIKKLFPRRLKGTLPSFNDHERTTINDIRKVVRLAKV